jgi:predicted acyltransferase
MALGLIASWSNESMPSKMISRKLNPARSLALDVFRGLTLAGMILVNNEGDWDLAYYQVRHTPWHGFTFADLVFPSFVFIMGVAVAFAAAGRSANGVREPAKPDWGHVMKRVAILFALGLMMNLDPSRLTLAHYRIPGVLQRIALSYLFCTLLVTFTGKRAQAVAAAGLLALYWALMKLVPVPGFGAGDLSMHGNLVAYIDNHLIPGHLFLPVWDPEGLLSTLPAIATGLIGVMAGHWLREKRSETEKIAGLLVAGCIFIVAGLVAKHWFPINKNLWSPSFVLYAGGLSMNGLAICLWFVDFRQKISWTKPFVVLGVNSIVAYVFSEFIMGVTMVLPVGRTAAGETITLRHYFFGHVLAPAVGACNAALIYALICLAITVAAVGLLYKKKIFIKI